MGRDGPYAQRPSYDIVGQGLSGFLSLLVDLKDPKPVGPTFSDTLTGMFAGYGILAALHARVRTGKGQLVETSLLQATMGFMNEPFMTYFERRHARPPRKTGRACRKSLPRCAATKSRSRSISPRRRNSGALSSPLRAAPT